MCWGPYQSFIELVADDPRCSVANPLFSEIDQPGIGPVIQAGSPLRFEQAAIPGRAPALGEHTEQILVEELGLSAAAYGDLVDRGVVQGA